jgi:uncharacterized membrane protein YgcG
MKKLLFLLFLSPLLLMAQAPEKLVHNPRLYVDDYADVYTEAQEIELDALIRSFFDTVQISLVTIKSFGDYDPSDYATTLGRLWGVGGITNTGLMIVIGVEDRKMFAATGYGIEGDLPDITATDLQYAYAVPYFKQGDYYRGSYDLIQAYINELSPSAKELRKKEAEEQARRAAQAWEDSKQTLGLIMIILSIVGFIGWLFYLRHRKKMQALEKQQEIIREEQRAILKKKQDEYLARQAELDKERRRLEDIATLERAESFLLRNPKASALFDKYPDDSHRIGWIGDYKCKRQELREAIKLKDAYRCGILLGSLTILLNNISIGFTELQRQKALFEKKMKEKREKEEQEAEERRIKRKKQEKEEEESRRSSSYSSSYSSPSSSSNDSSSGSSFGGGSFGGGGGGSSW